MDYIAVRSIFDPNVTFSIHDPRAALELPRYGCLVIAGAGSSLAETSSVGKILRQSFADEGITKTGDLPLDYSLQCIKREFFLNEAIISLMSRMPGSDVFAIGSYQPMAVFYHDEAESTHLWYKEADDDVIGFQALHLGAATFSIGVYATSAPEGHDRNIKAVAYGGDVGRVPRTIPNLLEPGEIGFATRVSYLHLRNLKLGPLPLPVVERYLEEGGGSVQVSKAGHAILATYSYPEEEPGEKELIPAPCNPTSTTGAFLALARQVRFKSETVRPEDKDLVGIIYGTMHDELITPEDEETLANISNNPTCPVSCCLKKYKSRDDQVKHIRGPGGDADDPDYLRLHKELYAKYQRMELTCCGETHTNFGVLVKHLKTHCCIWTDSLQAIQLDQPGQHLLLDAQSYMTVKIQREWRTVLGMGNV